MGGGVSLSLGKVGINQQGIDSTSFGLSGSFIGTKILPQSSLLLVNNLRGILQ